ncbi:MAG TPA: outer membrane beta-barrel protein [Prolixibacteraceae bacterium]|jgi:opacity protein-like surface antigen|nr:outer membrane beta-barrel protein [Prolixibacteraceae bacterium]
MKKKIILFAALLTLSAAGFAQKMQLGFQASPQVSWLKSTESNITNENIGLGIRYGLDADIFLFDNTRYALNTGLFITNHSFKARYNLEKPIVVGDKEMPTPVDIKYRVNYIELPLNIKLRSDQFYRFTYYGQFGLTNLINISASGTSSDLKLDGSNVNDAIRFFNLGMIVGGGAEYDVGGNTALNFGIQYTNYFVDATTIKGLSEKSKINSIRLIIGVMF